MTQIRFLPWIGEHYRQGICGKRIFVLGESHYCASPSDAVPTITQDIIRDLLDPSAVFEPYKNTYTKFAKALSGKTGQMTLAEKEELWQSVAFYNYVQTPVYAGPRNTPTEQQFKDSEAAFYEVLTDLDPDLLLAWGRRLYNHLPGTGRQGDDVTGPDGTAFETWLYPLPSGKEVRALGLDHPSAGFTPEYWNQVIMQLI